uniref:NADH-ubiquinone oxidoreductase chain 3 n=1 Tax=Thienemanniella tusimufegea TaxID=3072307 RepID=A0AA51M6C0_9DIPT|nr:NADH dehydrogenase subunit 3 [Thienemanniella tusimufegea]WML69362.1 NADH dehydrogenase subunit 3 [Thienemanniella tusimufegea]
MLLLTLLIFLILIISQIVMKISVLVAKKTLLDREKISPFECGFDPLSSSRIPFSIRFFLITIIFLIFDVEITLILPIISIMKTSNLLNWMFSSILFFIILLVGLFHEWSQGALNWNL